jgi:hypothetical protein
LLLMLRPAWTVREPIYASPIAGMTGTRHLSKPFFIAPGGASGLFAWDWPWAMILPVSGSQVARITGMSRCAWLIFSFL